MRDGVVARNGPWLLGLLALIATAKPASRLARCMTSVIDCADGSTAPSDLLRCTSICLWRSITRCIDQMMWCFGK
jgi:hypothetical protein